MGSFIVVLMPGYRQNHGAILADTMNRSFKTLLLWVLLAILPLHAVGAAMPMTCDPVHHRAMQMNQHDLHHHHQAGMAMHEHHHDAVQMHEVASGHDMADASADSSTGDGHPHAGCSACAAGCIGAAAPPLAQQSTPVLGGSEAVLVSPVHLIAGYTPASLDRPPRFLLA